jgi:spore germination protein KC
MIKRLGVALSIVLASLFTTGCWDQIEIEQRATILGLAIDPIDAQNAENQTGPFAKSQGPGYKLTAQIAIPGRIPLGPGGGGGATASSKPLWIISSTGRTMDDAMNSLQRELAEKVFLGHLRIIIVNRQLAETTGLHDIQDFLRRNAEVRRLAWLIVSTGSASEAMDASPKLERVPTLYLVNMMDQSVKQGTLPNVFLGNFWSALAAKGQDPVLPLIRVLNPEQVQMEGLAVFRDERMVGTLNSMETAMYMELQNEKKSGYAVAFPMPGDPKNSVTIRGTGRRTIRKIRMVDGRPSFDIYSRVDGNIEEKTGRKAVDQLIPQITAEASKMVVEDQRKLVDKMKQLDADIFGFGEEIRATKPTYWAKIRTKEQWAKEFPKIPVRFHARVYIRRSGMSAH